MSCCKDRRQINLITFKVYIEAISKRVYVVIDLKYLHEHNIRPGISGFQEEASLKKVGVFACANVQMTERHLHACVRVFVSFQVHQAKLKQTEFD